MTPNPSIANTVFFFSVITNPTSIFTISSLFDIQNHTPPTMRTRASRTLLKIRVRVKVRVRLRLLIP